MGMSIAGKITQAVTIISETAAPIPATLAEGRRTLLIKNKGSVTIFIGNEDVTTSDGFPVEPGEVQPFDVADVIIYGRTEIGSTEVRSLEGE